MYLAANVGEQEKGKGLLEASQLGIGLSFNHSVFSLEFISIFLIPSAFIPDISSLIYPENKSGSEEEGDDIRLLYHQFASNNGRWEWEGEVGVFPHTLSFPEILFLLGFRSTHSV